MSKEEEIVDIYKVIKTTVKTKESNGEVKKKHIYTFQTTDETKIRQYIGNKNNWSMLCASNNSETSQLIDVDQYWDFYNVMTPKVEVSFRVGSDWQKLNDNINFNNFFVSATIEDTGYRQLTLELYDRTFTTIQELLYAAIKSSANTSGEKEISQGEETYDLKFVRMPSMTQNNLRIRWGYNENLNELLGKTKFSTTSKVRWNSRENNEPTPTFGSGEVDGSGEKNNISTDVVLMANSLQTTVRNGWEEFYITNYQSNLTNTGIRYTITAVGSDALKLRGYKFVQKYTNIVDKPINVLSILMRMFNYSKTDNGATPKTTSETMAKLVWADDKDLVALKKITFDGNEYISMSTDEQKEDVQKDKENLAKKTTNVNTLKSLLGVISTKAEENGWGEWASTSPKPASWDEYKELAWNAGDSAKAREASVSMQKWVIQKNSWSDTNDYLGHNLVKVNMNNEKEKAPWFFCYALKNNKANFTGDEDIKKQKEAYFTYYLRKHAETYLFPENIPNTGALADEGNVKFYSNRYLRYIKNCIAADNSVYNFEGCSLTDKINSNFLGKQAQRSMVDLFWQIFNTLKVYIKAHYYEYTSLTAIPLPKGIFEVLDNSESKKLFKKLWKGKNIKDLEFYPSTDTLYYSDTTAEMEKLAPKYNKIAANNFATDKVIGEGGGIEFPIYSDKEKYFEKFIKDIDDIEEEKFKNLIEDILRVDSGDLNEASKKNFLGYTKYGVAAAFSLAIGFFGKKFFQQEVYQGKIIFEADGIKYGYIDSQEATLDANLFENRNYCYCKKNLNAKGVCYIYEDDIDDGVYVDDGYISWSKERWQTVADGLYLIDEYLNDNLQENEINDFCDDLANLSASVIGAEKAIIEATSSTEIENWSSAPDQLDKVIEAIENSDELKGSNFLIIDKAKDKKIYDSYINVTNLINSIDKIYKSDMTIDFIKTANEISENIKDLNTEIAELNKTISNKQSSITNDEITLSLGSANDGGYKSISSLLNEFCAACPPYKDYVEEVKKANKKLKNVLSKVKEIKVVFSSDNSTLETLKQKLVSNTLYYNKDNQGLFDIVKGASTEVKNALEKYGFDIAVNTATESVFSTLTNSISEGVEPANKKASEKTFFKGQLNSANYLAGLKYVGDEIYFYIWNFAKNSDSSVDGVAKYIDENGDEQTLDTTTDAPSYSLSWNIIGHESIDNTQIPIIGFSYRTPKIPKNIRRYCWGTGNPTMHVVKNLSITTSSEYAMLSNAAIAKLSIGKGGEKAAIKTTGGNNKIVSGANGAAEAAKEYKNYQCSEKPAYFNKVIKSEEENRITDAMFQAINKGTITVLGDPSLRFGGDVNPYTFPIYLDISLQNEGKTWSSSAVGTKSQMSGVYVVSKITHNINLQGYTTTMEILRYSGINKTVSV